MPEFLSKLLLAKFSGNCKISYTPRNFFNTDTNSTEQSVFIENGRISKKAGMEAETMCNLNSIFKYIGSLDGKEEVSNEDLALFKKAYVNEKDAQGVYKGFITNVRYDSNAGVETIVTKFGTIRIDFETEQEMEPNPKTKPEKKPEIKQEAPVGNFFSKLKTQPFKTEKTNKKHYYNRDLETQLPEQYQIKLNKVIAKMGIDEATFNKKVKSIAKSSGYSEYFIKYIISVEGYEPTVRDTKDGTITGGFGHSKLRDKNLKLGQKVTPDKAFSWLNSDIKFFEKKLKELKIDNDSQETIGDYWKTLPLSIKEAMIDVAFNRDHRKLQDAEEYRSLRANIKGGEENLPASAVRLRQDFSQYNYGQKLNHKFTTGLMHRNCYRFLLSIRDLDDEYRRIAKKRFENAGNYYTETLKLLRAKGYKEDAAQLEKAWNAM